MRLTLGATATVDYGAAKATLVMRYVVLIITGDGFTWRVRFPGQARPQG
jgi:hypothetical protein